MQLRHLPIQRRLVIIILATTSVVLLSSYFVLFVYETRRSQQTAVQSVRTMAGIIASNSTAALIYDDPKLAAEIIAGLEAEPDITQAALFDRKGRLFARYPKGGVWPALPPFPQPDGARLSLRELVFYQPVRQGPTRVGTLYIKSDLGEMYRRLRIYGWALLGVLAGGVLFTFYLSKLLQRQVSQPIMDLAETARLVTDQKDYKVRARKRSGDELGFVTEAFNTMLDQIEASHAALADRELQMRLMTDNAAVYLCEIDREHRLTFVNRVYARRFELEPAAVVGRPLSEMIGSEAYALIQPKLARALEGYREEFEIELPHAALGRRWIHTVYEPVRNEEGVINAVVAVLADTTERQEASNELKRARDEAVNASRAKDDFLAALSHELRTPLNPILLLATEAADNPQLDPEVRRDFQMVKKNVELEARLIDDLLDLTKITNGKLILKSEVVDVHSVLRDAVATVEAELRAKRIDCAIELTASRSCVRGDSVRLQQVFWNVLKNAVKFTPERGKVSIRSALASEGTTLEIVFTDTGIGIGADEIPHVFEAFSQGDHSKGAGYHRFGGLGLGLAISHKMISLHSGQIRALSPGRNQGSTFVIELPASDRLPGDSGEPWAKVPSANQSERPCLPQLVLLVEDHAPTRRVLEILLRRRGFQVVAAGSVAEARSQAAREKIDFVISDIGLPDGSGYELMEELGRTLQLKGIAMTGYGMESDVARSHGAGFAAHLTKPVSLSALEAAIAELSKSPAKPTPPGTV